MECYAPGECLGAVYTDFQPLADPVACHQLCIDTPDCLYWTHYNDTTGGDDYSCFAYLNCPDYSDEDCDNCISGYVECPLQGSVSQHTVYKYAGTFCFYITMHV